MCKKSVNGDFRNVPSMLWPNYFKFHWKSACFYFVSIWNTLCMIQGTCKLSYKFPLFIFFFCSQWFALIDSQDPSRLFSVESFELKVNKMKATKYLQHNKRWTIRCTRVIYRLRATKSDFISSLWMRKLSSHSANHIIDYRNRTIA